ncbi:uncharacterized protein BCR38DRAFT_487756 [Pseudomassariella vexata]|uniref:Uncharacterized protein n=1 Tax=Pseudomassariella vexata TaxID=1141098 RepID=A0A1Y2DN67_9PEZI|nr:uncharacterized protein BCR38DRAFT_487756 [Pseudomassariella vexata]ORY60687.1 hypothetical protein BCR38DRAFT_487756 [Pseudomassariella vexata]
MVAFTKLTRAVTLLAGYAAAHPVPKSSAYMKKELVVRDHHAANGARYIGGCSNSASAQALKARSVKRRIESVKSIREKCGIKASAKKGKRTLEDLQALGSHQP